MINPKLSIITISYRSKETIQTTIESVLSQDYDNIEYIIVNRESDDGTIDLIRQYEDKIDKIIDEPDNGIYDALNKGINLASGDIIGFLHADDFYPDTDTLSTIANSFTDDTDAVYGDLVYVSKYNTNKIVRYWKAGNYLRNKIRQGWMPPHPTMYIKKSVYDKCGMFAPDYDIAADYEFILRLIGKYNVTMKYIPQVLVKMRLGGVSNKGVNNLVKKMAEDYRAMRAHKTGDISTLIIKNMVKLSQFLRREEPPKMNPQPQTVEG